MTEEPAVSGSERLRAVKDGFAAFIRAFNEGDFESAFADVTEDFEVHLPPGYPEAAVRGRENVINHFRALGESLNWEIEVRDIVEVAPDRFLIELEGAGTGEVSGLTTERRFWNLLELDGERPSRLHEFADREQALAAGRLDVDREDDD